MTKEKLLEIIDEQANIYNEWHDHNNELENLPTAIETAFNNVKEAVEQFIKEKNL